MGIEIDWITVKCFGLLLVPFIIGIIVRIIIDAIMQINNDFTEIIENGIQAGFRILN